MTRHRGWWLLVLTLVGGTFVVGVACSSRPRPPSLRTWRVEKHPSPPAVVVKRHTNHEHAHGDHPHAGNVHHHHPHPHPHMAGGNGHHHPF